MITGVANVWIDFPSCSYINAPNGWLLNQKSTLLILFERCNKSEMESTKFYTHLFCTNELGEPSLLKNTRLQSLECALETWNELIAAGWTVVTNNFQ